MQVICQIITESVHMWRSHAKDQTTPLKAKARPHGTVAWALCRLKLHQQSERQVYPRPPWTHSGEERGENDSGPGQGGGLGQRTKGYG